MLVESKRRHSSVIQTRHRWHLLFDGHTNGDAWYSLYATMHVVVPPPSNWLTYAHVGKSGPPFCSYGRIKNWGQRPQNDEKRSRVRRTILSSPALQGIQITYTSGDSRRDRGLFFL